MLWLTWHMWILLLLAFMGGVVTGWILRGKSDVVEAELPKGMIEAKPAPQSSSALGAEASAKPMPSAAELFNEQRAARDLERSAPIQEAELVNVAPVTADAPVDVEAPVTEPEPAPEATDGADNLTELKGLGPKAAEKLNALGVTRFAQIANWSDEDVARIDEAIAGRGRIDREEWVNQAKARV